MQPLEHFALTVEGGSKLQLVSRSDSQPERLAASSKYRGLSGNVPIKMRRSSSKNGMRRQGHAMESAGGRVGVAQALGKLHVPRSDARRRAGGIKGRDTMEHRGKERQRWSLSDLPDRFGRECGSGAVDHVRHFDDKATAKSDVNRHEKSHTSTRRLSSSRSVDVRQDGLSRPLQFRKFIPHDHRWVHNFR